MNESSRNLTEIWGPRFASVLVAIMGIVNVLSAVTASLTERVHLLDQVMPLVVRRGSHLTSALAGFALLLLASGLWRRKRTAWVVTVMVLGVSAASHLVKGLDYEEALLASGLMVILWAMRSRFQARSDIPSIRESLKILAASMLFTLAYGAIGFYLLDRHYKVNFSLGAAVRQTVVMFTEFYDPGLEPVTGFGRYFATSIYAVGAITVGYALLMLIRPVLARRAADQNELTRARQIVEAHGRSSLADLTLLPDKLYFFSPGGSLIAYAVKGRVALALGDPIGPEEDFNAALAAYLDMCALNDWQPAYYQVLPTHLGIYTTAGFDLLCVGQEGIVDLETFSLEGRSNKDLRSAVNRFTKLGYQTCYNAPPLSAELLAKLRQVSDEWLEDMQGSEKRFSLGWFDDEYIGGRSVMTVEAPNGEIIAFANLIPEYQLNETTIDLMRHRRGTLPGTMDFLFVGLFQWAQSQGFATFNLGLSALSGIGESEHDPMIEKALRFIYDHVDQFYNFKGLHKFKEKFHPEWSPRYLAYPGLSSLPTVAFALARADSGDGLGDYLKI
ncbi:MAG: hypothetical protein A2Z16_10085 [Chloroflexi bacterium RBG_16_54_18]|nr:MAG: hypothetical protein A2Z16_10085 [Chloroflexi bacterium RBG_16_54_18]